MRRPASTCTTLSEGRSPYSASGVSSSPGAAAPGLDQIWVSEELLAASRFSLGEVLRVEHFNDHLHEGRDRTRSDHGFVRAVLKLYPQRWSRAVQAASSDPPL